MKEEYIVEERERERGKEYEKEKESFSNLFKGQFRVEPINTSVIKMASIAKENHLAIQSNYSNRPRDSIPNQSVLE